MKISDILVEKTPHLSFEVFPPKTDAAYEGVLKATEAIAELKPSYMSVTYGAGGGTSKNTVKIASHIKDKYNVPSLAHLTCVSSTKEEVHQVIDQLKAAGIEKVPKSWDEFQTMCEQISEWALNEKNEVKALQPTAEGYLYCMDHMLAGSEDSRFEGHNLIFQDEIFNNAINRMKRMYNSAISENAEYSYRDETHLFNEGKLEYGEHR